MPVIKIKVEGKIAKNLTPEVKIVCGNEDYTVEFEFDSTWQEENVKTGIVAFNGVAIRVPFKGNKLELPKLKKTNLCGIGVKTDDGKLQTTTPAYVECLYSAEDLTDEEIPTPTKDVYDQIIELINKTIIEANIPYDELPLMDGVAQAGESNNFARGDHRHPTDENLKAIAEGAKSVADLAKESAELSLGKAETAIGSATNAVETANEAKELSQTASANAQQALNTANNIDEIASSALGISNNAFERASENAQVASEAEATAKNAKEIAESTKTFADAVNEKANLALNTANEAKANIPIEIAGAKNYADNQIEKKASEINLSISNVETKANNAQNTANDAKTLGESAKQKANTALEQSNELKLQIPYFGTTLEMVLDQSTYVLTAKLFNKDGTVLSMQTVDLPLETMVVSGRYDYITKQIILTLKNGETISFPVVDLVDGIVSQDTFTAELYKKVDKISIANQLLGTDGSGNPTSYPLDSVGTKVLVDGVKVTEFNADEKANKNEVNEQVGQIQANIENVLAEAKEYTDNEIATFDFIKVVDVLPETGLPNRMYFVAKTNGDINDLFDEYLWVNNSWEYQGTKKVEVDLSDYVKTTDWATATTAGLVIVPAAHQNKGIARGDTNPAIEILPTTEALMDERKGLNPVVPKNINYAVKLGLTTNSEVLTDEEKASACEWLGAVKQSTSTSGWGLYGRDGTKDKMFFTISSANTAKIGAGVIPRYNYDYNNTETEIGSVLLTGTPKHSYHAANKKYIDNLPDYLTLTDEQKAKWQALFGISESGGGGSGGGMTEDELGAYLYNNQFYPLPSTEANSWLKSRFAQGEITDNDILGADKVTPISQIYATGKQVDEKINDALQNAPLSTNQITEVEDTISRTLAPYDLENVVKTNGSAWGDAQERISTLEGDVAELKQSGGSGGGATETLKLYRVTGTLIETDGSSYAPCEFLFEATVKNNNEGLYEANTLTDFLTNSEVGLISFRVMHKTGQAIFPLGATVDTDMSTAIIYGISEGMVFYKTPDGSEHLMANISIEEI